MVLIPSPFAILPTQDRLIHPIHVDVASQATRLNIGKGAETPVKQLLNLVKKDEVVRLIQVCV